MTPASRRRALAATFPVVLAAAFVAAEGGPDAAAGGDRQQSTSLISRSASGGIPNGASTNAVLSGDRRYVRVIAFQSEASDIVSRDTNGVSDVFMVRRAGSINNQGTPWRAGPTTLVSKTYNGRPANGPSFAPAVDGGFDVAPKCIAFLSGATNLVRGDTNRRTDAFLVRGLGTRPKRLTLPGGRQPRADATHVAVSGDCSRVAFVSGGRMYVKTPRRTVPLRTAANPADPSFSTGRKSHLVFGADGGVYLSRGGTTRPRRVARGGADPAYNTIVQAVLAYEVQRGGRTQIGFKKLGGRERIISSRGGENGNGDSTDPVIGNSGNYVSFDSEASNLSVDASGRPGDTNDRRDIYLFTDVRDITLVQSVEQTGEPLPGGGANPSMSFYANYILFDSPAPLGSEQGERQVFMRYLGGI